MTETKEETKTPTGSSDAKGEDVDLKAKIQTLQNTIQEREKQLQVSAMQNARLMDSLSKAQRFVLSTCCYVVCNHGVLCTA